VAGWVRALVMLWTLAVVGVVAWMDVKAGNRPDAKILLLPAGAFTLLYGTARRRREVESAEDTEDPDAPDSDPDTEQ